MNTPELIVELKQEANISRAETQKIVQFFFDSMVIALGDGAQSTAPDGNSAALHYVGGKRNYNIDSHRSWSRNDIR